MTPDGSDYIDRLLRPQSIAIIGASEDPTSLSGRPLDILLQHAYKGRLYPVNPNHKTVAGLPAWPDIASVPEAVDLAMVLVRAALVPTVLRDCAAAGVRTAVVFTSGFAEEGPAGAQDQMELTELARSSGMRILGPNAEGYFNLNNMIPVSFSPAIDYKRGLTRLQQGNVAIISQSGGLGFALFNWGQGAGLGASYVLSTGNESDLEALELSAALIEDAQTEVLALLIEGFQDPDRLSEVASRAKQLGKHLVIAKLGTSPSGARAALAHTAHDCGDEVAYQKSFDRCGVLRVHDQEELLDVAFALSRRSFMGGPNVGIITSSGGAGAWLADACHMAGLQVPTLSEALQSRLRPLMPSYGSPQNPVDVTAQIFGTGGLAPVLEIMCDSPECDAVVLACSLASPHMLEKEAAKLAAIVAETTKPVLVYTYTNPGDASVDLLVRLGMAWYPSPRRAATALAALHAAGIPDLT